MKFPSAHKKIRRANKHIADIRSALERFCGRPDSYTARIDFEPNTRQNVLCIDIRDDLFPQDDVSSSLADALHNLRNALNHMFYQVVITCGGSPTEQTCFPIRNSRKDVVARIETLFRKQQINAAVLEAILNKIKPYPTGNPLIWMLHHMNAIDKHVLLIPVLQFVAVIDIHLEDEKGRPVGNTEYYLNESSRIRLRDADDRRVIIKDKGHAYAAMKLPLEADNGIEILSRISAEVTKTVELFESLLE